MSNAELAKITNWAPIVGRWSIEGDSVAYLGPDERGLQGPHPIGICVSNISLSEGEAAVEVRFSTVAEGRILFGYRSLGERYVSAGLGGYGFAYTITEFEPAYGWRGLAVAGSAQNLRPDKSYKLQSAIIGQRIKLSVDEVPVLEHVLERPLTGGQLGLFAWGASPVQFGGMVARQRLGQVFVVMQFSEPYKQLYEDVIRPVVARFGLKAYHVGEVFGPGVILNDIAQGIVDSKIVIAEITPVNQNVFYELGYSHALGKPTILLAERGKQLPFDITGYRVLFYENSIAGKRLIEEGLSKHLEAIVNRQV